MTDHWPTDEHAPGVIAARHDCPACKQSGAIYGAVDVDGDADVETKHGETQVPGY